MSGWIYWDFDGTLGYREGMFSGVLYKVLKENYPHYRIERSDIQSNLHTGFPWHNPEISYEAFIGPNKWWSNIENIFKNAYVNCGIKPNDAGELARLAHFEYITPKGFELYPDTVEIIKYFKECGWSQAIFSNHVPELPVIADALGLCDYMDFCVSSANIGYEKPNKMFLIKALSIVGGETENAWMIGDSYSADIKGSESVGIKSVLVRSKKAEGVKYYSEDLLGLKDIIL